MRVRSGVRRPFVVRLRDETENWPGDLLVSCENYRPGPMKPEVQVIFRVRLRELLANIIPITDRKPGLSTAGTRRTLRKTQQQPA